LGVALVGRTLYVADTYNNKLKTIDLSSFQVTTLAGTGKPGADDGGAGQATFDEPAGITTAAGKLFVADTNNHLIRVVELGSTPRVGTLTITGLQSPASAR
jgi:DNA-binding beta-propeller fold protein YncE